MMPWHIAVFSLTLSIAGQASAQAGSVKLPGFPIPPAVVALSQSITPHQYSQVIAAIEQESAKPAVSQELDDGPGLGALDWISASQIALGSLGNGVVVDFGHSPSCGNGGCPMWLLLRRSSDYAVAIRGAGWGYSVVNSGGSVPDIVFYWQMGAGETDVAQYHYRKGKFVPIAAHPHPGKCDGEDDKRGMCTERAASHPLWSITPAEYEQLRAAVKPVSSTADSQRSFADGAHALDFSLINDKIARILGIGNCTTESNCAISIYGCAQTYPAAASGDQTNANFPQCRYWPMLSGVSGWGVANVSDWNSDPFARKVAFIIAGRLSATEVELKRYSMVSEATGPHPGKTLALDSCEIVSPGGGKWPSHWDPQILTARPATCGK